MKTVTLKELENFLKYMRERNPYPIDLFPEPFENGGWGGIGKFLSENGYPSDLIFAKWGRMVWNNCINDISEFVQSVKEYKP